MASFVAINASLVLKVQFIRIFSNKHWFWDTLPISPTGPQRVNASCLELVLWIIFSTRLFKCSVFKSFPRKKTKKTTCCFYILIVKQICHLLRITDFSLWMCLLILVSASISSDYLCFTFSLFVFFLFSWLCMPLYSKWLKSNFTSVSLTNLL